MLVKFPPDLPFVSRKHNIWKIFCRLLCGTLVAAGLVGCTSIKVSETPRTAVEQLLLSHASDKAMEDVDLTWLNGKKIFVDDKYFDGYDKAYAISLIRQRLLQNGALLMSSNTGADVIVEIRSGALSMNTTTTLFGIPSIPIPIPLTTTLQIPEIAFYKSDKFDGMARFALYAYDRTSGQPVGVLGAVWGRSHYHLFKLFFLGWTKTDLPELKHKK